MVDIETREPLDGALSTGGAGSALPPDTLRGTPDFGNQDDWERWEADQEFDRIVGEIEVNEAEIVAAILRHPSASVAREIELTQKLLQDGWHEKHMKVKKGFEDLRILSSDARVFFMDDYRPRPFTEFPPSIA